ncbi:hypothetical protein [Actinoplanes sp. NPDC026619]|uniref:hypothetical protein n=1 Tax=Actinoplanes sp. NPDC026619 TaxID=3155798 RepID=UPI0033FC802F
MTDATDDESEVRSDLPDLSGLDMRALQLSPILRGVLAQRFLDAGPTSYSFQSYLDGEPEPTN